MIRHLFVVEFGGYRYEALLWVIESPKEEADGRGRVPRPGELVAAKP